MDTMEYLTYRLGIWERVKSDTARIISTELLLMRHRLTRDDGQEQPMNNAVGSKKVEESVRNLT